MNKKLDNLLESLIRLINSIRKAKNYISIQKTANTKLLERLSYYEQIAFKAYRLALTVPTFIEEHNEVELARHVKLINALTALIHEDIGHILLAKAPEETHAAN